MLEAIRNPVFLAESSGCIDDKLLCLFIISCCSFHLNSVVAVAEFSKAEAANNRKVVNFVKQVFMAVSSECKNRASKKVELNRKFDAQCSISHGYKLVSGENVVWVGDKVLNTYDLRLSDDLEFAERVLSCLVPVGVVVNWLKLWVLQNFKPLVSFLGINSKQNVT